MMQLLLLLVWLVPSVLYFLLLQNTLKEIHVENRKMQPWMVWIGLVPYVGFLWQFVIVYKLTKSLTLEFDERNVLVEGLKTTFYMGLAYCILFCCIIIPMPGPLLAFSGIVCWILYWLKISSYKTKLVDTGNHTLDGILDGNIKE